MLVLALLVILTAALVATVWLLVWAARVTVGSAWHRRQGKFYLNKQEWRILEDDELGKD